METIKKRSGYYYEIPDVEAGVGYPSVTTILKVLAKPELTYWIKRETAREAIRTLDEQLAIAYCDKKRDEAGDDGSTAHRLIDEYWKGNKYDKEAVVETVRPYLDAFEKFLETHKPEVVESEQTIYSHKNKYAGTCDGLFKVAGEVWLIDWKTANGIYWDAKIQIIAYKKALEEMGHKVDQCAIVQLKNNGLPMVEMVGETENGVDLGKAFLAAKYIYDTKEIIR